MIFQGAVIMNIHRILALVAFGIISMMLLANSHAQTGGGYDLSWNTLDGGGGTSAGGSYEISGSIGQVDAGVMSGGSYTLSGGFWSGVSEISTTPRHMIWFLY